MIRRILAAGALALGLLAVPVAADASGPTCTTVKVHRQRVNTLALYGNGYFKSCIRPHAGHSIRWLKPASLTGTYRVKHILLHSKYWCAPAGTFQGVILRFYISNPATGYNAHTRLRLSCDGEGMNADAMGMTQMPRCYMPWESSGGRADTGHRDWCRFRMTVEGVQAGPVLNEHFTLGGGWIVP